MLGPSGTHMMLRSSRMFEASWEGREDEEELAPGLGPMWLTFVINYFQCMSFALPIAFIDLKVVFYRTLRLRAFKRITHSI